MTQAPAEVNAVESRQRMKDHTELLVRTWLPAPDGGEPRGTVILVHGMAEHSGRYPHVAKVLTDLGLPGMNGHELVEAALKINPALKVIIASGYSTSEDQNDRLKGARYLTKPFDMQQLRRVLEA